MPPNEIDEYLDGLPEAQRAALGALREQLRSLLPDADEGLSYGVPAFRVGGRPVAGFSAAAQHLSFLPHSGSITATLADRLAGWSASKGAVKFTPETPLPTDLVQALIEARLAELADS